jgi:energy-coupling factor transport system ATP-binding protein
LVPSLIKLTDLSFRYNKSEDFALSDINLEIKKGEFICITGSSGGGKTTLALTLCGFIPHIIEGKFQGQVNLKGYSTTKLTIAEISQLVGLVQQDPENQLVTSSPFEEVAFGPENLCLPREEIFERITKSLAVFNLESLAFRSINALSGGEKQQVAIASILAMCPEVLVLDEPTAFLDHQNTKELLKALNELNQNDNITIIIIDHQPVKFKDFIDRMIVIENGRIYADYDSTALNFDPFMIPQQDLQHIQQIEAKTPSECIFTVQDLSIYLNNRRVLNDISLNIESGLIYGLIGPNGAGKTTFLESLLNLIPSGGSIIYNNQDISQISTHQLAYDFGLVFQNPNHQIFENTVLDEILFAPRNFKQDLVIASKRAESLISEANLNQYEKHPPFSLSYGEKRRLNICSIDIYEPPLLLLDEPFIGQDSQNISYLLKLLKRRKLSGKTTIIVSHRKELFDIVDYFFVLDKGKLLIQGNPESIINFYKKNDRGIVYE